jgi:O-antigen/teichoic acid export membrane protein
LNFGVVTRIGRRLSIFVGGQSAVQLLNAATGMILLRLMAKPEFAVYSVALSIQTTINMLTDLGFGNAIQSLVGTRYKDRRLFGEYIKAASSIRRILLLFATVISLVGIVVLRNKHFGGYGRSGLTFLAITVLVTVQFQAWASYYETPLLLNSKLTSYYSPQIAAAVLRIAIFCALYFTHSISATTAIVANTLSIVVMGLSYRLLARPWIEVPQTLSKEHAREIGRYLLPLLPMYLYGALSGQISMFLISVFGHVSQVADVAAATRIGQLFMLLNASVLVLIMPLFARTPPHLFRKRYAYVLSAAGLLSLIIAASGKLFPGLYLLVLGPKYSDLRLQVQLVVYASAVMYFWGVMWSIAMARKWVFWWSGMAQVAMTIIILLVSLAFLPLNTSEGILRMNLYTLFGSLFVQIIHLIKGLSKHSESEATKEAMAS